MERGEPELRLSNFDLKLTEPLSSPNPWRPKLTPGLNNSFSKSHFFFLYYHHPYRKLRNNHFFNHSPIYPKPVKYKVIHAICEHNVANIYIIHPLGMATTLPPCSFHLLECKSSSILAKRSKLFGGK